LCTLELSIQYLSFVLFYIWNVSRHVIVLLDHVDKIDINMLLYFSSIQRMVRQSNCTMCVSRLPVFISVKSLWQHPFMLLLLIPYIWKWYVSDDKIDNSILRFYSLWN